MSENTSHSSKDAEEGSAFRPKFDASGLLTAVAIDQNTRDVIIRVFPNSGQYDDVEVDVQRTSTTTATLVFATAPASNAYRVVVLG
jgi:hypothetical protein